MSRKERLRQERDAQRAIRDTALAQAAAARDAIERIDEEISQLRELRIPEPASPIGKPLIVYFEKRFGCRVFDYAAIRAQGLWFLTQDGQNPLARRRPMTWEELLEFVGEEASIFRCVTSPVSLADRASRYPMPSGGYV